MPKRNKSEPVRLWPSLLLLTAIALLIGRFSLQRNVPQYPDLPGSVDVVVLGSGITGATAALTAAESGAEVFYIHLSEPDTGGFPAFSPAFWAAGTPALAKAELDYPPEQMATEIFELGQEEGNLNLILRLSEATAPSLAWVEHLSGVPFSPNLQDTNPGLHLPERGEAQRFLPPEIIKRAEGRAFETSRTKMPQRLIVEDNRVRGVVVRDGEGKTEEIYARAVILADGGYGSNEEMLDELANINHVTDRTDGMHEGVGLRLAMDVGAETLYLDSVTLMPVFLPEGQKVGQVEFPGAVIVNSSGEPVIPGENLALSVLDAGGRLFIIYGFPNPAPGSQFTEIEDVESLASGLGMEPAAAAELTQGLTAPYYVAVVGTVALTPGGLVVDEQMRVSGKDGIFDGLYAAGELTAGIHGTQAIPDLYFSEWISSARIAGREAAEWALR